MNLGRIALIPPALLSRKEDGSWAYPKSQYALHRTEPAFLDGTDGKILALPAGWCCLGVMSDVAIRNGLAIPRSVSGGLEIFDGYTNAQILCPAVVRWYGLGSQNPLLTAPYGGTWCMGEWNDHGLERDGPEPDFMSIAEAITRTYLS